MPGIVRNILAGLAGFVAGSVVNMGIVVFGTSLVPPPEGVDVNDAESIARSIHLFGPQHFVVPFLAHALGTIIGSLVAFRLAASRQALLAYVVGALFFAGGVAMSFQIPAPAWFIAGDLIFAYFPMAYVATLLGRGREGWIRRVEHASEP